MWRLAVHVSVGVAATLVPLAVTGAATAGAPDVLIGSVVYVHDGDTIDVRIGERVERVRYIGVDAPEIAHEADAGRPARSGARGGAAAARINGALVGGRSVRLELDVERRDRYGRLLAYVWVGRALINAELVARGYARSFPIPPNLRHASLFAALETQARLAHRGLWSLRDQSREDLRPPPARSPSANRPGVPRVARVRARFPERARARIRGFDQYRHPPGPLHTQPALSLRRLGVAPHELLEIPGRVRDTRDGLGPPPHVEYGLNLVVPASPNRCCRRHGHSEDDAGIDGSG